MAIVVEQLEHEKTNPIELNMIDSKWDALDKPIDLISSNQISKKRLISELL